MYEVIRRSATKHFSNYLYLTDDKAKIDSLASNHELLIKQIKYDAKNRTDLSLSNKDFRLKSSINGPNGSQIYNNIYTVRRNLSPRTKNVYAMIVSFKQTSRRYIIGNIAKETILIKNISPTSTSLYTLNKSFTGYGDVNSIWPSSAHLNAKHIMAGNIHTLGPHPILNQRTILNTKIKDFRILKEIESLSFAPAVSHTPGKTYLSPIELSRNDEGDVHGFFSLEHLSFATANTNFGQLQLRK